VPTLRVVMAEAGFAWPPSSACQLDKMCKMWRPETPHLKRLIPDQSKNLPITAAQHKEFFIGNARGLYGPRP
jgi:hypothetical protein